jgi:hypothetical protein
VSKLVSDSGQVSIDKQGDLVVLALPVLVAGDFKGNISISFTVEEALKLAEVLVATTTPSPEAYYFSAYRRAFDAKRQTQEQALRDQEKGE